MITIVKKKQVRINNNSKIRRKMKKLKRKVRVKVLKK